MTCACMHVQEHKCEIYYQQQLKKTTHDRTVEVTVIAPPDHAQCCEEESCNPEKSQLLITESASPSLERMLCLRLEHLALLMVILAKMKLPFNNSLVSIV